MLAAGALTAPAPAGAARLAPVYPVPRSEQARPDGVDVSTGVALVAGAGADPSALAVVRAALRHAGVRAIEAPGAASTTVYVGGPGDGRVAAALRSLRLAGAAGLPAEGYVLGIGRTRTGAGRIVLQGVDASGQFYAAQTLRRLLGAGPKVAGVAIRDWPTLRVRGVVEGFYGRPWSLRDRLSFLDFEGAEKLNAYVYAPKDDPYARSRWRDAYPAAALAGLHALVARADADHVTFTYMLSPGLSICYSSPSDLQALLAKLESLWQAGVRSFAIAFDDVDYLRWSCDADRRAFGTGPAAAGAAQTSVLDAIDADLVAAHPGAAPLEAVPSEYSDTAVTPYKSALAAHLSPGVIVEWTGAGVVAPRVTAATVAAAGRAFGHPLLLWDNYPVNDYEPKRLLLGPYRGRDPNISSGLVGITANPMIEAEASRIPLFTAADFDWNAAAYDPARSWSASLAALAGGDGRAAAALAAFADVNYSSALNPREAPLLSARIAAFWRSWPGEDASEPLRASLERLRDAPAVLRARLRDGAFLSETAPWLAAARSWAQASLAALDLLVAERAGRPAAAAEDRVAAERAESQARRTGVVVGPGVLDAFVARALATRVSSR